MNEKSTIKKKGDKVIDELARFLKLTAEDTYRKEKQLRQRKSIDDSSSTLPFIKKGRVVEPSTNRKGAYS